jgi:trans-aconitate methyltransferase
VAVEFDPKFLNEAERPNVTVVRADIRTAQLPQQSFDVVHARYVLIHLPDYRGGVDDDARQPQAGRLACSGGA